MAAPSTSASALIPRPALIRKAADAYRISDSTAIGATRELGGIAEKLRAELSASTGFAIPIRTSGEIELVLDPSLRTPAAYTLDSSSRGVRIAGSAEGVFYGTRTLLQMLPPDVFRRAPVVGADWIVPGAHIEDEPRFEWRGLLLDVCRHFMPKEFVLKLIDLMALHKLNRLHLHLTDDQGWRIEIKKYPRLTEVGSKRPDSMLTYDPPTFTGEPHSGFYTQDDLREIVAYAGERFVCVVPEIEMPGHAQAAIAAYRKLGNTGEKLPVRTWWGISDNVFNTETSTLRFLQDVLDEVMEIFPSPFIHVGGDECPKKQWKESPRAQARMRKEGLKDEEELQSWFVRQMDSYLESKGRRLIGWDEILEGGLAPGATVMSWRGERGGIAAANAGHDVVMCPSPYVYFDYYQSRNRAKEPHAIGGYIPLSKVYDYDPLPKALSETGKRHILGAQGQLWTEYIPGPKHVEYMAFPRACALAEVVWSPAEGKDWRDFERRLRPHLERLAILDVGFRPL